MVPVPVNGAGNLLTLTRISLGSSERQEALSEKGPVIHYQLITCAARRKTYSSCCEDCLGILPPRGILLDGVDV